jgi:hypothetical protein
MRWRALPLGFRESRKGDTTRAFLSGCTVMVLRYSRWGSVQYLGHGGVVPSRYGYTEAQARKAVWEVIQKRARKVEGELGQLSTEGGEFQVLYPVLWDYLTQTVWPDGSERKTSSLTLFADEGVMKVVLKDRDASQDLWASAPSMDGLFVVLEACLADPGAVWRTARERPGDIAARVRPKGVPKR